MNAPHPSKLMSSELPEPELLPTDMPACDSPDHPLSRLLTALDLAIERGPHSDLHPHPDTAALRLRCLSHRLGVRAKDSPYLRHVRRLLDDQRAAFAAHA